MESELSTTITVADLCESNSNPKDLITQTVDAAPTPDEFTDISTQDDSLTVTDAHYETPTIPIECFDSKAANKYLSLCEAYKYVNGPVLDLSVDNRSVIVPTSTQVCSNLSHNHSRIIHNSSKEASPIANESIEDSDFVDVQLSDELDNTDVTEPDISVPNATDTDLPYLEEPANNSASKYPLIDWISSSPNLIAFADSEYVCSKMPNSDNNYLRGCLWSPDGSCILTNSHDNVLRLFNLPSTVYQLNEFDAASSPEEMKSVLTMRESELIYDYCWYPTMDSTDPVSCCLASTSRRNPIRLWDAFTGTVRATYRPINHLGESVSASSITFSQTGSHLYAGFHRYLMIFDVSRPGTDSIRRPKLGKKPTQGGIISCISVLKDTSRQLYATGSYNGTVCVYSEPNNVIAKLYCQPAGVTQVKFNQMLMHSNAAPWYVLVGGRMDPRIFIWDARNFSNPVSVVSRCVQNYQKFQFDVDDTGQYLFTGGQTGMVSVYDISESIQQFSSDESPAPKLHWPAHSDSAHGLSLHPTVPIVATTSGQRRIPRQCWSTSKSLCQTNKTGVANLTSSTNDDSSDTDDASSLEDFPPTSNMLSNHDSDCTTNKQLTSMLPENRLCLWSFPVSTTV